MAEAFSYTDYISISLNPLEKERFRNALSLYGSATEYKSLYAFLGSIPLEEDARYTFFVKPETFHAKCAPFLEKYAGIVVTLLCGEDGYPTYKKPKMKI